MTEKDSSIDVEITKEARSFKKGDWVEVTLVGHLWGEGEILDISTSSYGGSRLYPVYYVESEDGDSGWFPAISLTRI